MSSVQKKQPERDDLSDLREGHQLASTVFFQEPKAHSLSKTQTTKLKTPSLLMQSEEFSSVREESPRNNQRKQSANYPTCISPFEFNKFDVVLNFFKHKEEGFDSKKSHSFFHPRKKKQFDRKILKIGARRPKSPSKQEKISLFKVIRYEYLFLVNLSNGISICSPETSFRAYIDRGNNGLIIKQILKRRYWWHMEDKEKSRANLVWTEWHQESITQGMREKQPGIPDYDQDYSLRQQCNEGSKEESVMKLVGEKTFKKVEINEKNGGYLGFTAKKIEETQCRKEGSIEVNSSTTIHNHIEGGVHLHSKKLLFKNFYRYMKRKQWNPYQFVPLTFYIHEQESPALLQLFQIYDQIQAENPELRNIWICKEESCNRGNGITVLKDKPSILKEVKDRFADKNAKKTIILQKYLQKCFLINNRKFDIRCYILLTTVNGSLKGYWYKDGYIRTSSYEYNLQDTDNIFIHLTNDAIQRKNQSFGKFEDNNKMNFYDFKKYLQKTGHGQNKFMIAYQKMKMIAFYLIASVSSKIRRKQYSFELFGLDFMLDSQLNPFLIEANSNPALDTHGKILGSLIHDLVDNVITTAIDPIFQPPPLIRKQVDFIFKDYFKTNQFQLIFSD